MAVHGDGNLFFPKVSSRNGLDHHILKQRIVVPSRTFFIDNTNLTMRGKKGLNCLLCAASNDGGRSWMLASTVVIDPRETLLCPTHYNEVTDAFEFDPPLISLQRKDVIMYLNKGESSLASDSDGLLSCNLNGPDHVPVPGNVYKEYFQTGIAAFHARHKDTLFKIINHPKAQSSLFKVFKNAKRPHLKGLKIQEFGLIREERSVNFKGPISKLLSEDHTGYACFYIPEKGLQHSRYGNVFFLPHADITELMARDCLSREDYNAFIYEHSSSYMTVMLENIGSGLNLQFHPNNEATKIEHIGSCIEPKPRKEHFEHDGIVLSHYFPCPALHTDLPGEIEIMLASVFGNFKFDRPSTKCIGRNLYQGLNRSARVRATPRKATGEILDSEYYRKQWKTSLLPVANTLLTSLGRHSTLTGLKIDQFYDHVTKYAFSYDTEHGNVVGSTMCPNKRFSRLIILTSGSSNSIAFSNQSHDDKNDWFDRRIQAGFDAFISKLSDDINSLQGNKKQTGSIQLPILMKMRNHLSLLKSLSPTGSFAKETVCGYKFLGSGSSGQELISFFLHTALGVAVKLESDVYHWFRGGQHRHQTAVSVLWDRSNDTVSFNNPDFQILAWGTGAAKNSAQGRRREFYIRHFGDEARVTRAMFLNRVNAAVGDIREEAIELGLLTQDGQLTQD